MKGILCNINGTMYILVFQTWYCLNIYKSNVEITQNMKKFISCKAKYIFCSISFYRCMMTH